MPNISSLTMPDGIVYAIKDSQARKDIEDIKKGGSGSGGSGGSGGGVLVVNVSVEPAGNGKTGGMRMVCDKTADEMLQASETKSVVLKTVLADNDVVAYMHIICATFAGARNGYQFLAYSADGSSANSIVFSTMNADGYPSYSA